MAPDERKPMAEARTGIILIQGHAVRVELRPDTWIGTLYRPDFRLRGLADAAT